MLILNVNPVIISILSSIFEMTKGSKDIFLNLKINDVLKICLVSFSIGFSGLCVIFQIFSCIFKYKFSLKKLVASKLLQGIFSFFITYLLLKYSNIYLPNSSQVFLNLNQTITYTNYINNIKLSYLYSTIIIILILLIYFISIKIQIKKQSKK